MWCTNRDCWQHPLRNLVPHQTDAELVFFDGGYGGVARTSKVFPVPTDPMPPSSHKFV